MTAHAVVAQVVVAKVVPVAVGATSDLVHDHPDRLAQEMLLREQGGA